MLRLLFFLFSLFHSVVVTLFPQFVTRAAKISYFVSFSFLRILLRFHAFVNPYFPICIFERKNTTSLLNTIAQIKEGFFWLFLQISKSQYLNYNCSNFLYLRNLQVQVKKTFCYTEKEEQSRNLIPTIRTASLSLHLRFVS